MDGACIFVPPSHLKLLLGSVTSLSASGIHPEQIRLPPHFLQILREFHDGMSARVTVGGHESDPLDVLVGVKQGCVLAPAIFNLFLVAVTLFFCQT